MAEGRGSQNNKDIWPFRSQAN